MKFHTCSSLLVLVTTTALALVMGLALPNPDPSLIPTTITEAVFDFDHRGIIPKPTGSPVGLGLSRIPEEQGEHLLSWRRKNSQTQTLTQPHARRTEAPEPTGSEPSGRPGDSGDARFNHHNGNGKVDSGYGSTSGPDLESNSASKAHNATHDQSHGHRGNKHPHSHLHRRRAAVSLSDPVAQLILIAPTSNSCTGASFPAECTVSSSTVVTAIVDSFVKYNISTAMEQVALLSWMAFESGDFKYNANHFPAPGRPGQGTRAMLMPNFVAEYAASLPELKDAVSRAGGDPAKVLALVQSDEYAFGAAAWFYKTHCTVSQKEQVRNRGKQGWEDGFVTGCVQTSLSDDRTVYWDRTAQALGMSSM